MASHVVQRSCSWRHPIILCQLLVTQSATLLLCLFVLITSVSLISLGPVAVGSHLRNQPLLPSTLAALTAQQQQQSIAPVSLPVQLHSPQVSPLAVQSPLPPSSSHSLKPVFPLSSDNNINSSVSLFVVSPSHTSEILRKHPLQDKLQLAQQSLNDLFSDILSKPLGHLTNGSLLSLENLIIDRVKLPRPINVLIASLSHSGTEQPNNEPAATPPNNEANELVSAENQGKGSRLPSKVYPKKKKGPTGLGQLVGRCYEPYGCFHITEPFRSIYRPINLIPEPPSNIKISFHLRTRSNPSVGELLTYSESSQFFKSQTFRPTQKLKLIVHGYLENGEEQWIKEMSAALLNKDDVNVISVDWMLGATPPYTQAVANTRLVGAVIAHLIRLIQNTYPSRYPVSLIHIIGHSLGAHIAGYTGELIPDLGRITGLDPAEPYFQYTDPSVRLDPTDAHFVEVVHTDVGSIISGGFGMNQTCGHVDFYPNGGINQPGCKEAPIKNVWDSINKEHSVFDGIRRFIGCNHLRSFILYTESINSECPFMAYPCRSYEEFANDQCTWRLMEANYPKQCFDRFQSTTNSSICPIRFGLNSEQDYQRYHSSQQKPILKSLDTDTNKLEQQNLVYFMQTADRSPFCHYHYQLRLFIYGGSSRLYSRNYRNRHLPLESVALNGRLLVTIVGSRSRTVAEFVFKPIDPSIETTESTKENKGEASPWREHHLILSHPDLGTVLRLELEWRPTMLVPRQLMQMQSRALRWWLPQSPLPAMITELQRTLNGSQINNGHLLTWSNQFTDVVSAKSSDSVSEPTQDTPPMLPLLEAMLFTQLETGQQEVFCVQEPAVKLLFQTKSLIKSAVLLRSNSQLTDSGTKIESDNSHWNNDKFLWSTEGLVLKHCANSVASST